MNPNINFSFPTQRGGSKKHLGQRFNSISHATQKKEHMAAFHETAQASNMRNSEKRKIKRSFPRPKASNILGLN